MGTRMFGGANRDRTDDLYNAIVALSQLSYSPTRWKDGHFIEFAGSRQHVASSNHT